MVTFGHFSMKQSFWTHPDLVKFANYSEKLEKSSYKGYQVTKKGNWERGLKKMQQLAISYGIEYNPKSPFEKYAPADQITWIKLETGETIGITTRKDIPDHAKKDGLHVFNAHWLDFMMYPIKDKKTAQKALIKLFTTFDGKLI